jgi:protein-tyrosine phosphatase
MPPQEVSVFLLARQLIRPNILVLDARAPGDYLKGTRLKAAIPYYDGLLDTEVGLTHYERVIGYGQLATQVVELFQASHHNIFTGDLDAFAKEFPEHCWCSMSEEELAEALSQPATLVVDTRREGFERGLRLKNAVNFIPNVGFTGWCRRVVNEPWYRNVVCYGMEAVAAAPSFPHCNVHIFTGDLEHFARSHPEHCFDTRRCHQYCQENFANELVHVCDSTLYIGSLAACPSHHLLTDQGINHVIQFTLGSESTNDQGNPGELHMNCINNALAPPVDGNGGSFNKSPMSSPPASPAVRPEKAPVTWPRHMKVLHLKESGNTIQIETDKCHPQEFCPTLPPTRSKDTVDLSWIVDVLNTLFQGGHRVAVLCEYGIRRSTAVAVAYLHLAKGLSPADALNAINNATNFCNPSDLLNSLPSFHSRQQYVSPYKDLVVSHIIPGLLCGSLQSMTASRKHDARINPDVFRRHNITHVLSLGERPPLQDLPVQSLHIAVEDTERDSIAKHLAVCFGFIDNARQAGGSVMVHCLAGVSRTGAVIVSYLMHHCRISLRDAFLLAWRKRPILQPNDGFLEELCHFEQSMFEVPSLPIQAIKDFDLSHRRFFKWAV